MKKDKKIAQIKMLNKKKAFEIDRRPIFIKKHYYITYKKLQENVPRGTILKKTLNINKK